MFNILNRFNKTKKISETQNSNMKVSENENITQPSKIFLDDDKYNDIYNIISKKDIKFKTDDNLTIFGQVDNKLWICAIYQLYPTDKSDVYLTIRAFRKFNDEDVGKSILGLTIELKFSDEINNKLKTLVKSKIESWRINNLEKVERERNEMINNTLKA